MHILVIEDEAQLCSSIAEGLRLDGYEVDACMDGNEGLELCLTEPFDLILLDLNLPGMDGLSILQQLRTENSSTPVIILSARTQIQDKVEGLDLPLSRTRKESSLLEYFLLHPDQVISPEELIEHIWDGSVNSFSNSIRVHISSLRKKLRAALGYDPIQNKIGEGYLLNADCCND